jgi:hypothetical protein
MTTATMRGEEVMTDKQWDGILLMIVEILKGTESKQDAINKILRLVKGEIDTDKISGEWKS